MKNIILSVSSDIGYELAIDWKKKNFDVSGTYRNFSPKCDKLIEKGVVLFECDLENLVSIDNSANQISKGDNWDCLVLAAGTQNPIGKFNDVDFNSWAKSLEVNFVNQARFLHKVMPYRNNKNKNTPKVLFFAGGGTNNATLNYSAYTISKIASIKLCELLDAEYPDTIFTILGPGWVKTKIHKETLIAGEMSGNNLERTNSIIKDNLFFPMEKVIQCCNWILNEDKSVVGGRNFSAVHDPWEENSIKKIATNTNYFKLRRNGNELFYK